MNLKGIRWRVWRDSFGLRIWTSEELVNTAVNLGGSING
jgi:hypothetical protein